MTAHPIEVLACVDRSDAAPLIAAEGAILARAFHGRLHLLHVAATEPAFVGYDPEGGPYDRNQRADELTAEHAWIHELAEQTAQPALDVRPLVVPGPTVATILAEADRFESALIVVGSHGHRPLHDLVVGGTTAALLRKTTRPIVVVPAGER